MKTGMLAAEAAFAALGAGRAHDELADYPAAWRKSWVYEDLYKVRNVKPGLKWGMWPGTLHGGLHMWLNDLGLGALVPWTLRHTTPDHASLAPAAQMPRIAYPKYDGVLTFDKLSSVFLSNTNHEEDQPVHLQLRDPAIPVTVNLAVYDGPEARYCPAGVYEFVARATPAGGRAAADQRAELRALQDLRHQGSAAEHPLGHARGRRRTQLHEYVIAVRPTATARPRRARRSSRRADGAPAACRRGRRRSSVPTTQARSRTAGRRSTDRPRGR